MLFQMSEDQPLPGEAPITTSGELAKLLIDYERWFAEEVKVLNKKVITTNNPDWLRDLATLYLRQAEIYRDYAKAMKSIAESVALEKRFDHGD